MQLKEYGNIKLYHGDCMDLMRETPDKYYDIAIVDPPYGIGFSDYERVGMGQKVKERYTKNEKKKWDNTTPSTKYFTELFRISQNQIIWGGNYFDLPPTQCFLFWYKQNPVPNFADGEMAWTSFKKPAMCFDYRYYGNLQGNTSVGTKIHPTQKPVLLYDWIIKNYVNQGAKILDTHLGSGSIVISVDKANRINNMNLQFTGIEIDVDYFNDMIKRFENYKSQLTLTLI